jgi:hypothetical protein
MILMDIILKTCVVCTEPKLITEYYTHPHTADGYLAKCKECEKACSASRYSRIKDIPEEKAKRAAYGRNVRLRQYDMTVQDYDDMLTAQNGECAICGAADNGKLGGSLPVDHNHETGEVRGILCHSCNVGLGHFGDDPDRLVAAAAYLLSRKSQAF